MVNFSHFEGPHHSIGCSTKQTLLVIKDKFMTFSKLNEFAGDNFRFDEYGRKFSKWVENTVGKGEIARNEQFLLFHTAFSKTLYCIQVNTRACLGKG